MQISCSVWSSKWREDSSLEFRLELWYTISLIFWSTWFKMLFIEDLIWSLCTIPVNTISIGLLEELLDFCKEWTILMKIFSMPSTNWERPCEEKALKVLSARNIRTKMDIIGFNFWVILQEKIEVRIQYTVQQWPWTHFLILGELKTANISSTFRAPQQQWRRPLQRESTF